MVEVIQKEDAVTTMSYLVAGASQLPRRRNIRDRDRKIQNLFQRLEIGTITLGDYLDAIKHHTGQSFVIFVLYNYYIIIM